MMEDRTFTISSAEMQEAASEMFRKDLELVLTFSGQPYAWSCNADGVNCPEALTIMPGLPQERQLEGRYSLAAVARHAICRQLKTHASVISVMPNGDDEYLVHARVYLSEDERVTACKTAPGVCYDFDARKVVSSKD